MKSLFSSTKAISYDFSSLTELLLKFNWQFSHQESSYVFIRFWSKCLFAVAIEFFSRTDWTFFLGLRTWDDPISIGTLRWNPRGRIVCWIQQVYLWRWFPYQWAEFPTSQWHHLGVIGGRNAVYFLGRAYFLIDQCDWEVYVRFHFITFLLFLELENRYLSKEQFCRGLVCVELSCRICVGDHDLVHWLSVSPLTLFPWLVCCNFR